LPEFPRVYSKGQLTTQAPSVQAAEDTTGEIIQKVGEVGGAIQKATLTYSNALDSMQKSRANLNYKTGVLEEQQKFENIPNPTPEDYENTRKSIEKLGMDSLKGFSNKSVETEMAIEFAYQGKVATAQIDNSYKKKQILGWRADTIGLLDLEIAKGADNLEGRLDVIIDPVQNLGGYDKLEALNLKKEYLKKGKFNSFLTDIQNAPAIASENISKNTYGFDVRELRDAQSIYDTESKKIQAKNQSALLDEYLSKQDVTVDAVDQLRKEGKISPEFAEGMINKINNPKPDIPSKDKTYIEFQNKVMDMQAKGDKATTEEIIKLMSDTIQAHAKGLLDTADVERILKDRNELVQQKLEKVVQKDIMNTVRPKNLFDRLSFWSDEYAEAGMDKDEIKARMYRKLIDGALAGQDQEALAAKVVNDEIEIQLAKKLTSTDRIYANDESTKERKAYSDDGGATWYDIKTGKEIK